MGRTTVDELLQRAREGLERLTPAEALAAAREGAVIVDVRSRDEQYEQGALIPGAVHYPLSVVLWRLDPDTEDGVPKLPLDTEVILVCRHGYCSSIAAAQVRELGFARAADLVGGAEAWIAAGLPVLAVARRDEVDALLARVTGWAAARGDVVAAGLAGSWARADARDDSDVDLIVLTEGPDAYTGSDDWIADLGATGIVRRRSWGALEERRLALPSGLEVEVGLGHPGWAAVDPLDAGTRDVVRSGFRVLHDPYGVLRRLVDAAALAG
jgi:rhodanese-related sulfurtransferase/predicted nucleotidyltransferase